MPQPEKIVLIPWDAESEEHVERMRLQRVACGWRADEVQQWAKKQRDGTRIMYWMVGLSWHI